MPQVDRFRRSEVGEVEPAPRLRARFFYNSNIAIDDALAPVPPPAVGTGISKQPPRPFSPEDNAALDKAWTDFQRLAKQKRQAQDNEASRPSETAVRDWKQQLEEPSSSQSSRPSSRGREIAARSVRGTSGMRQDRSRQSSMGSQPYGSLSDSRHMTNPDLDGAEEGVARSPFIRAPARSRTELTTASPKPSPRLAALAETELAVHSSDIPAPTSVLDTAPKEAEDANACRVPVGQSRLHHVTVPALAMEPTYWAPVNDIAPVTRATWFYKDSMLPVEVDVANMLEAGYITLKPWTSVWQDELNSAAEVGAIGEEKIAYTLWPEPVKSVAESRPGTSMGSVMADAEEDSKEHKRANQKAHALDVIERSSKQDEYDNKSAGVNEFGRDSQKRSYQTSQIIYADSTTAYILRPNLQPSEYYGRRPYANYIRKQHKIGIAVVRGFDQFAWDILHPSKDAQFLKDPSRRNQQRPGMGSAKNPSTARLLNAVKPQTTDLILVVHGIGQKLSERMESYHFTHAMNAFRREMNVERAGPGIKRYLRDDAGQVMILPVNWRSTLSFEEGGYRDGPDDATLNNFTLQDITPESLPSVRNIISDVMLDIPYYLSHHQPKMISAVLKEANRIYRLWCKNNPGFEKHGRVHLLAHSLGSVMALDILSKQPSSVREIPSSPAEEKDPTRFCFDTTNLFLCGSPAGFFLLLKRAGLSPRRDRQKPSAEGEESMPGVAGEQGEYGCIAVDNVYNVINPYDPVAYRLNACVDAQYSALLKPTFIPSVRAPWYSLSGSKSSYGSAKMSGPASRPGLTQRLPTSVEMETHNFTREEIAERRAYLLNDNGQIDFFLRYGGGPLEIQYLTMLGAHSSYWLSRDFIKFLMMEVGRKPGRDNAVQALRAVKKQKYAPEET